MRRKHTDRKDERGLTLVEVLVAFFILFVVTLAVLQLLAMAYLVNLGSTIRTELTYKAEQVVETARLQLYRKTAVTGVDDPCCPVGAGTSYSITPTACQTFWGPAGANVMSSDSRYALNYWIDNNATMTVQAVPLTSGPNVYLGPAGTKVVVYVAQLQ
jgi:Tfp pilus assembly protein FimT